MLRVGSWARLEVLPAGSKALPAASTERARAPVLTPGQWRARNSSCARFVCRALPQLPDEAERSEPGGKLFVRIIKRWVLEDRCKGSSKEFYSGCMLVCKTRPAPAADRSTRCLHRNMDALHSQITILVLSQVSLGE